MKFLHFKEKKKFLSVPKNLPQQTTNTKGGLKVAFRKLTSPAEGILLLKSSG